MYIKVTVFPDFKKELVEKNGEDNYKIYVREPRERGQVNKKIVSIFNKIFPNKQIRIVTGQTSTKKLIEVR